MATRDLDDLLVHELRELYDAEHELVKILAALAQADRDARTAQMLNTLRCETRNHVFGLEQVLSTLGQVPRRVKDRTIQGLAEAYNAFLRTKPAQAVLDTYDLIVALKAIRSVIGSYRILITLALRLKRPQIVDQLRQNLWDAEGAAERFQLQLARNEQGQASTWATMPNETTVSVVSHRPATFSTPPSALQLPPDSPEDRENVLAGGQEAT